MKDQKKNVEIYFNDTCDEYAGVYDKKEADSLRSYIFFSRRNYILNMLDLQEGKVLDIGCGPGILTRDLLERGCHIWNIDISEAMVEKAKERMRFIEDRTRAYFEVGDIEKLKFENNFFDTVICSGVLEYLPNDTLALREVFRVLRPGGVAIFTVPNLASPFVLLEKSIISVIRFFRKIFSWPSDSLLFREDIVDRYYFPVKFKIVLKKNGFKIEKASFHAYRFAFLNLISRQLALCFARNLEFLSGTPLRWMGASYIIKVRKE